jgi:hypothetical protein
MRKRKLLRIYIYFKEKKNDKHRHHQHHIVVGKDNIFFVHNQTLNSIFFLSPTNSNITFANLHILVFTRFSFFFTSPPSLTHPTLPTSHII